MRRKGGLDLYKVRLGLNGTDLIVRQQSGRLPGFVAEAPDARHGF